MKRTLLVFLASLVLAAPAAQAAPWSLGPRLSIDLEDDYGDDNDVAIGIEARFEVARVAPTVGLALRPSFDFYLADGIDIFNFALDVLFTFDVSAVVEPYAGAGLGIFIWDIDGPADGGTDAGLNLVGGVKFFPHGSVQPFVELRPTIGDVDPILLTLGVLFQL